MEEQSQKATQTITTSEKFGKCRLQISCLEFRPIIQILTQIFLVSFTIFISSSLYPFSRTGALCENILKAYCTRDKNIQHEKFIANLT